MEVRARNCLGRGKGGKQRVYGAERTSAMAAGRWKVYPLPCTLAPHWHLPSAYGQISAATVQMHEIAQTRMCGHMRARMCASLCPRLRISSSASAH